MSRGALCFISSTCSSKRGLRAVYVHVEQQEGTRGTQVRVQRLQEAPGVLADLNLLLLPVLQVVALAMPHRESPPRSHRHRGMDKQRVRRDARAL
jgi:hypothetical protein